jgi:hypothetical protein
MLSSLQVKIFSKACFRKWAKCRVADRPGQVVEPSVIHSKRIAELVSFRVLRSFCTKIIWALWSDRS